MNLLRSPVSFADHRIKYQTEQRDIRSFDRPAHNIADTHTRSKLKRRHNSSSDSSLLEVAIKPKLHPLGRERSEHDITDAPSIEPKKKRKFVSSDSDQTSISSTPRDESFEKRARYKTREERYEPKEKKSRNSDHVSERKGSKRRRGKRGDRKKRAKRAGEELMYKFSSNRIGQERLTVGNPMIIPSSWYTAKNL
jgi:hypothetical protein